MSWRGTSVNLSKDGRATILAVLCIGIMACGGSSSGGNAADSKAFTYGPPGQVQFSPASEAVAPALQFFGATITADTGFETMVALNDAAPFTVGSEPVFPTGVPEILAALPWPLSSCSTVTATGVTFTNCTAQENVVSGCICVDCPPSDCPSASSAQMTAVLDGHLSWSGDSLSWSYTVATSLSTGETDSYTGSGTLSVTATAAQGHEDIEWSSGQPPTGVGPGRLAQALDLDVTYDQSCTVPCTTINGVESSCPSPIIGGSLEAKRVWTQKPSGTSVSDHAAKWTWTGCNQATYQTSQ
jgi:hypothetical protein